MPTALSAMATPTGSSSQVGPPVAMMAGDGVGPWGRNEVGAGGNG